MNYIEHAIQWLGHSRFLTLSLSQGYRIILKHIILCLLGTYFFQCHNSLYAVFRTTYFVSEAEAEARQKNFI